MPIQKRITIEDVANEAGVSKSTASRVMNGVEREIRVSAATSEQVRDAASRLGYRPNLFAAALRTQKTGVIGVIVRDINDPFLNQVAQALQRSAHAHGVELLLGHAAYDRATAARQQSVMRDWFDGLLMVGDMLDQRAVISKLGQDMKDQSATSDSEAQNMPLLCIDDELGVLLGVNYLLGLGHKRIALLGNTTFAGMGLRVKAFEELSRKAARDPSDFIVKTCVNQRIAAAEAVKELLSLDKPPTAVFCMSDLLAMGALNGCWQAGWRVPDDISILGFDDVDEAATEAPPLTTIRQPMDEMADKAFKRLIDLINRKQSDTNPPPIMIKPELVIRSSCAAPKFETGRVNKSRAAGKALVTELSQGRKL